MITTAAASRNEVANGAIRTPNKTKINIPRTLSSLLNGLIDAGLAIERVVEPVPDEQQIARHPEWIHERRRPFCLVVRARKQVKSP